MSSYILVAVFIAGLYLVYWQIAKSLAVIHDLVNSTLTKAQSDLELANRRIEVLEAHIVGTESKP
jgi:hypothetical protein